MKLIECREQSDFERLRESWNGLLSDSASNTIFLSWEWLSAWWSAYGEPAALRIVIAMDDDGVTRGIAPLRTDSRRRYGQNFPCLRFLGDGSNDSDYLDCIIAKGWEPQVMEAFLGYLRKPLSQGTLLTFNEIPDKSPNLEMLRTAAASDGHLWTEDDVPCSTVRLPDTWDAYVGMLKSRFRTKVRSVLRNLEAREDIRFGFCETQQDLDRLHPILFDLHTRRWNRDGRPGVFGWDLKRKFYAALSPVLLDRGWLRFSYLEWNGRILACQYGFVYNGIYSQLQEGYEPECEHWNPGVGLRAWTIREFLKEGIREYDFLGGTGRHKSDWGSEIQHSKRIVLAAHTSKNLVYCRGPQWEERAKESVKQILPEKVLAMRKAAMTRTAAGPAEATGFSLGSWTRQAMANVYFNTGLSGVARPLREQFQLRRNGRPHLERRHDSSVRILYYHRVNDDNDPFFPAITSSLFEEEMRYISRRYHVVPLGEGLDRMEQGSREPVLAITFDDGYQDNYQYAFPILERYGLPATIFLTTGSLDSREPLWFERLALALKKSSKEFIDLELDLPRRFYLRNEAERLQANDGIFGHLRRADDVERRRLLDEILGALDLKDESERRDKMLTWDQVRLMKAGSIDFGGHTVTHPFISRLPKERVAWEVSECKRRIEEELQTPVKHFAYPNGREEDFGMWNKAVLREAGYRAAVTTIWGVNDSSTDPMELRRGGPWEESAAMFAYKLDWYQLVND